MFYAERRSPTRWCAQLTPEAPHGMAEADAEVTVKTMSGARVRLRHVRRVPDDLVGATIDRIRAALFAAA